MAIGEYQSVDIVGQVIGSTPGEIARFVESLETIVDERAFQQHVSRVRRQDASIPKPPPRRLGGTILRALLR